MRTMVVVAALLLGLSLLVSGNDSDVHEILNKYGFPSGLLPNNVKTYSLTEDGDFSVELKSKCYVQFSDLVYYDTHITGKLQRDSITGVSGIQVKKLFAWLPITDILMVTDRAGKGKVEFQVGFLTENFPVTLFETIPSCRSKLADQ